MGNLPNRIKLVPKSRRWLNDQAEKYHYMHSRVHPKSCPFGWAVEFDGELYQENDTPSGFIIFSSIHYTKLKNEFGYDGLPTKWQVLSLSRLWLHDNLPRNSESVTISKALRKIQRRWIQVHPPRFPDEPYHIRKVISYADTGVGHEGTIYKATNFRFTGQSFSPRQENGTRGKGTGTYLNRYIYDLDKPDWEWWEPLDIEQIEDYIQIG